MNTVKFKNSLAIHNFIFGLIKRISYKIQEIENYQSLKMNPELTTYVLQCINEEIAQIKKNLASKIDVKAILTEVLKNVFKLSDTEITQIEAQLDFITDNKLIKKKGLLSALKSTVVSLVSPSTTDPSVNVVQPSTTLSTTAPTQTTT